MSSEEFTLWKAFYSLEPWGTDVENFRMGTIAATVANSTPRPHKAGRPPKAMVPSDFYCDPYRQQQRQEDRFSPEQREFLKKRKASKKHG